MKEEWVRGEDGAWRRATQSHMGRRLPGYDYRRCGYYVITIVLADRRSAALGELVVRKAAAGADGAGGWLSMDEAREAGLTAAEIEAKVVFSELGRAIFAHFQRMGEFTPGLKPVYCAVMPDHIHLLLQVVATLARPLGNAIGGFKTGCEKIYAGMGGEGRLFAPGFVDEIVLRAGQLASEFAYLVDNPRRLAVKRLCPELFRVARQMRVNFRLASCVLPAPSSPVLPAPSSPVSPAPAAPAVGLPASAPSPRVSPAPSSPVLPAPAAPAVGWFAAIGNHFLLTRPDLRQVQCSRRYFAYARDARGRLLKAAPPATRTAEFDEKLEQALSAAHGGAVIVSPCISQGEREIARQVFAAGGRVITLSNKGFSPLYKPGGKTFDACADGRLLMLAPAAWPYQPAEKQMTRGDALVLNRIAQLIAGDGAARIDYKGAVMGDVDRWVSAAVEKRSEFAG